MKRTSVTLIGMGPRGLSLLERIAVFARASGCLLQVNLVEPGECGPGAHGPRLPQHLRCATPAGQLTIFPAPAAVELASACAPASLAQWARAEGYRRFGAHVHQGEGGAALDDADCLPRSLLGRYLAWAARQVMAAMPPTVAVTHLRHRARDIYQQPDGSFVVELECGMPVSSDFVMLATGPGRGILSDEEAWCRKFAQDHARYNSRLAYLRHPWPLEQLAVLGSDALVGIQGMGLGAHDVVAALTVGRGGRFVAAGAGLRYLRSGQEPRLLLYSRSCLPALSRPAAARTPARFLTRAALRTLREAAMRERASVQLDFERELLPLLLADMACAWRAVQDGSAPGPGYWPDAADSAAIDTLLFPLRGRVVEPGAAFGTFLTCLLADDLSEARRGKLSPAKAAAAALAQSRAVLQEAIAHGGLTPASHRKFLSVYHPAFKRVAFGPPAERNEQWLALIDAGVLALAGAPNAALRIDEERSQFALHTRGAVASLDGLVVARHMPFSPETDDDELMRNLLQRGTVRPYYNGSYHPGGIDVDAACHPVSRSGRIAPNLWALGGLVEGAQYACDGLPHPQANTPAVRDADRCVRELFATIGERASAGRQQRRHPKPVAAIVSM